MTHCIPGNEKLRAYAARHSSVAGNLVQFDKIFCIFDSEIGLAASYYDAVMAFRRHSQS